MERKATKRLILDLIAFINMVTLFVSLHFFASLHFLQKHDFPLFFLRRFWYVGVLYLCVVRVFTAIH